MIPFETLMMILVLVVMTATCLAAWKINKWLFAPLAAITLSMFIYTYDDTVHKEQKIQTLTKSFDAQLPILCQQNGEKYLIDSMRGWKRTHDHFLSPKHESIEINPRGCDVITQEREHYLLEAFVVFWLWIIAIVVFQSWKMYQMIMNSEEDKEESAFPSPEETPIKLTQQQRKEKIRKGAKEMAQHYRTDPDLKEMNESVGDCREEDEDIKSNKQTLPLKDREIRERVHEDDDDTNR